MYQTWAFRHNTLSDLNRSYTATYNRLNLVSELRGPGSNAPGGSLAFTSTYQYDGLGRLRS